MLTEFVFDPILHSLMTVVYVDYPDDATKLNYCSSGLLLDYCSFFQVERLAKINTDVPVRYLDI